MAAIGPACERKDDMMNILVAIPLVWIFAVLSWFSAVGLFIVASEYVHTEKLSARFDKAHYCREFGRFVHIGTIALFLHMLLLAWGFALIEYDLTDWSQWSSITAIVLVLELIPLFISVSLLKEHRYLVKNLHDLPSSMQHEY